MKNLFERIISGLGVVGKLSMVILSYCTLLIISNESLKTCFSLVGHMIGLPSCLKFIMIYVNGSNRQYIQAEYLVFNKIFAIFPLIIHKFIKFVFNGTLLNWSKFLSDKNKTTKL